MVERGFEEFGERKWENVLLGEELGKKNFEGIVGRRELGERFQRSRRMEYLVFFLTIKIKEKMLMETSWGK